MSHILDNFYRKDTDMKKERKYLPTLSELIDRLSISQLKEVFITDHKGEYALEIEYILNDIDLILQEKFRRTCSGKKSISSAFLWGR